MGSKARSSSCSSTAVARACTLGTYAALDTAVYTHVPGVCTARTGGRRVYTHRVLFHQT
jgi:hypothetical protein